MTFIHRALVGLFGLAVWSLTGLGVYFAFATATTYYVATTGDDARSCVTASNIATPKLTIASAKGCLAPGDTLDIRGGTYVEGMHILISGTAGNYITIQGHPGETVTLRPNSANFFLLGGDGIGNSVLTAYIIYKHFILDGVNTTEGLANQNGGTSNCISSVIIGSCAGSLSGSGGTNNIIMDDVEITNAKDVALFTSAVGPVTFKNGKIHDTLAHDLTGERNYCAYIAHGSNVTIEHSDLHDCAGGGIQIYPNAINTVVRWNKIHHNNSLPSSSVGGIIIQQDTNQGPAVTGTQVYYNWIYNNGGASTGLAYGIKINNITGAQIYGNTIVGNKNYCIGVGDNSVGGSVNTLVKNNICWQNSPDDTVFIFGNSTGTVTAGNRTTNPSFVNAGAFDFTLTAGSGAISAGVSIAGFPANGTPEQGANEVMAFASCVVENATPSLLSITMTNNVFPPVLPASGITGFTARKAGANDVITSAVRTGTNQIDLTLTTAIINGNAVDFSYSGSGNLTDSALIGGVTNQPYNTVVTNQSCTNNVGAAANYIVTQTDFRWNGLRGTEGAPISLPYAAAPQNTNIFAVPGAQARLRISLKTSVSDAPPWGYIPWYSRNAGAYTLLSDTFTADGIAFCGTSPDADIPASGTATTNQLSTTGTFVAGAVIRSSNAIPTLAIPSGQKTELEYCIAWASTVTPTDTYDIRLRFQDGTVLPAYTTTPRATIIAGQGGSGF